MAKASELSPQEVADFLYYKSHALADPYFLGKYILGFTKFEKEVHGKWSSSLLEDIKLGRKSMIKLKPRFTYKSSLYTITFAIWLILHNPDIRILLVSNNYSNAAKFVYAIGQLMETKRFKAFFGDWMPKIWSSGEFTVVKRSEQACKYKEATITALGILGRSTGGHFDWALSDDPVDENDRNSEVIRASKIEWWKGLIPLVGEDGKIMGVGTIWHFMDLWCWIINTLNPELKKVSPQDAYSVEQEALEDEQSQSRYPIMLPTASIPRYKTEMGMVFYSCQMNNMPLPPESTLFKQSCLRTFNFAEIQEKRKLDAKIGKDWLVAGANDPALGKSIKSCYAPIITGWMDNEKVLYIVECKMPKVSYTKISELILQSIEDWKTDVFGIEAIGFQEVFKDNIKKEIEQSASNVRIIGIENKKSKEIRIESIENSFTCGNIRFRDDWSTAYPLLLDQLLLYPAHQYFDGPDVLEMLVRLTIKRQVFTFKNNSITTTKREAIVGEVKSNKAHAEYIPD